MQDEVDLIFVYGTLRTEYGTIGALVGPDRIAGALFDLGGAPGYHPVKDEDMFVVGEVIRIPPDLILRLDVYEGVAQGLYTRHLVTTEKDRKCWVYQINPEFISINRLIRSGDWFKRPAPPEDNSPEVEGQNSSPDP